VSECENFIVGIQGNEHQGKKYYQAQIYSLYEEKCIYKTEMMLANQDLELKDQFRINSAGDYFYQFEDAGRIGIYKLYLEDEFFQIKKESEHLMNNVQAISWSPLQNYLAVF